MKNTIEKIIDTSVGIFLGSLILGLAGQALVVCNIAMFRIIVKMIGG